MLVPSLLSCPQVCIRTPRCYINARIDDSPRTAVGRFRRLAYQAETGGASGEEVILGPGVW